MSVVTFLNFDKEQTGKTMSAVAVATQMAIERNYNILLISTGYRNRTIKNCFWAESEKKRTNMFGIAENNITVENGIEGLSKLIASNKIQPSIVTDYTRVIFKGRLEILNGYDGGPEDKSDELYRENYYEISECYPKLISIANEYYDMVIVDVDRTLKKDIIEKIVEISDLNINVINQKLTYLNRQIKLRAKNKILMSHTDMTLIGKYLSKTKFNLKNVKRFIGNKKDIYPVPFNILFYEAAEEANVVELFLKLQRMNDTSDENYVFIEQMKTIVDAIVVKLQEIQKQMR